MIKEPICDIAHLGHLELLTPKFEESRDFFIDVMGMTQSGREGRQRLSARLGRLRALFAQAHRLENLRHGACRLSPPLAAGAGAARRGAERLGLRHRLERRRSRPRQDLRLQGPGRPRHRALLRDRMVRGAAGQEAGAEEPGAALSGARLQRAPARPLERARGRHQGEPRFSSRTISASG